MEILNNFGIQPTLLLAQIVNFVIILFILKKFFYKPITKALQERKKRIEESLKNAQQIEERLKATEEKSAQIIATAQNNAQALIADAKTEAERITNQTTADARQIIDAAQQEAKNQIAIQHDQLLQEVEKEAVNLVAQVVKKILGRSLRPSERRTLSEKAISELTRQIQ